MVVLKAKVAVVVKALVVPKSLLAVMANPLVLLLLG
jgi:hypothetical protein